MIVTRRGAAAAVSAVAVVLAVAGAAAFAGAKAVSGPGAAAGGATGLPGPEVARRKAVEIGRAANGEEAAVLGRPLALAWDGGRLYIADGVDCAVKVFSRDGRFLRSFGRKGAGPGELSLPSGLAVAGGAVAVADKLNFRIQKFDGSGKLIGGFKVPFAPDRICALRGGRFLVTANPSGKRPDERLLHAFDATGREVWTALDASRSSDPALDAFRNMILVCPGDEEDFYVVRRIGERTIRRFSASGAPLGEIVVDERHAFRSLDIPSLRGTIRLEGFCWAAAHDGGRFYLSAPDPLDGRDLGPGRTVSVVDGQGRLLAVVELACPVHRFLVVGGRMFAVDDEGELRIFEVGR